MSASELDKRQIEAAHLLADGKLSNSRIAERVGVTPQTLWNWRQREDFAALLQEHRARFAEEVLRRGIADRMRRVKALNDRWNRMQQVIVERAVHPDFADAPGGRTGLLCRSLKKIGSGECAETVVEFAVDTGLLSELRQHEKQAAQELGQWDEKHVYDSDDDKVDVAMKRLEERDKPTVDEGGEGRTHLPSVPG